MNVRVRRRTISPGSRVAISRLPKPQLRASRIKARSQGLARFLVGWPPAPEGQPRLDLVGVELVEEQGRRGLFLGPRGGGGLARPPVGRTPPPERLRVLLQQRDARLLGAIARLAGVLL